MAEVRSRRRSTQNDNQEKKSGGLFKILQVQIIICCLVYLSFLGIKMVAGENYKAIKAGTFETTYKLTNLYDLNFKLDELAKKNRVVAFLLGRKYFYNTPKPVSEDDNVSPGALEVMAQEQEEAGGGDEISSVSVPEGEESTADTSIDTAVTVNMIRPLAASITPVEMSVSEIDKLSVEEEPLPDISDGLNIPETVTEKQKFVKKIYAPVPSGFVTSPFGVRNDPLTGKQSFHTGIDLRAASGTKVKSFADGTVVKTGKSSVWGNYLLIEHADGFASFYAHLSSLKVDIGDKVRGGKVVALSGNTGRSTGPHLHFEIRIDGKYTDPTLYLDIK